MGELSAKLRQAKQHDDKDDGPELNAHEQATLAKMQREAKAAGATLATGGRGNLPPSMVLGCLRRDNFACKLCGGKKDLTVHHKAHLENPSPKMVRFAKKVDQRNDPKAIVTVCTDCHTLIHNGDRANSEEN